MVEILIISVKLTTPGSSSMIGTGTMYGLEILRKFGKGAQTKSQNVLGTNPYFLTWKKTEKKWLEGFLVLHPYILNKVMIKRAQEARDNQFLFQNVQNNEIFEIFKMFKNCCWINVYYAKSKHLQFIGLLFYFPLEIPFLGKFGPKTKNCLFELKLGT